MTASDAIKQLEKLDKLYEGKAKIVYATSDPEIVIQHFKDSATAFNAQKVGTISGKGEANARITTHLFSLLEKSGVPTQMIGFREPVDLLTKKLDMLPVEVVVRNVAAGSLAERIGYEEGTVLKSPIVEFYYKDDALGDPLLTSDHIAELGLITPEQQAELRRLGLQINAILSGFFAACNLKLIDFKIEFGLLGTQIVLGDEISPDTCRLWDMGSGERMDKDRFRRDLGGVEEAYREVLSRVLST